MTADTYRPSQRSNHCLSPVDSLQSSRIGTNPYKPCLAGGSTAHLPRMGKRAEYRTAGTASSLHASSHVLFPMANPLPGAHNQVHIL